MHKLTDSNVSRALRLILKYVGTKIDGPMRASGARAVYEHGQVLKDLPRRRSLTQARVAGSNDFILLS